MDVLGSVATGVLSVTGSAIVAYVVTRTQTRGEIKKMRDERKAAHYSHRQSWYHNTLNAERKMRAVKFAGEQPGGGGAAGWLKIKTSFREAINGVIISGTEAAMVAARKLGRAYDNEDENEADAALSEFVDAVRADLAPPDKGEGVPGI